MVFSFQKSLHPCVLDESNLSIGKVIWQTVLDKRVSRTNLCRKLFPTYYRYFTLQGLVCENDYINDYIIYINAYTKTDSLFCE